ncbi:MAG: histidine phosphatase family protein [Anaerolineae bacterium]|nr:histidine phosphatase family protein [Anaerolineae bacterium]
MTVNRVILIRPGETDWNRQGRWQGWVASPLDDYGRAQAKQLARYIRNIGMSALYSSDSRRAVETAEILAAPLGFMPVYDALWRERDIGAWQGMTLNEIRTWHPEDYRKLQADTENFRVPEGESRADVRKRVLAAFEDVLAEDKGGTVGLLTHTTSTHMLLHSLIAGYDIYAGVLGNTAVTTIHRPDSGPWKLVALNDLSHLEGLNSRSVRELEQSDDSGDR